MAKNNLQRCIKIVINALEKDFVEYKWDHQSSCNCGLMVQAILDEDAEEVDKLFIKLRDAIPDNEIKKRFKESDFKYNNWRDVTKQLCTVTGRPVHGILQNLKEEGFLPEDIVHLEYLNNPAILELSGIDISKDYYSKKDNLILYLKAWNQILDGNMKEDNLSEKVLLEAKLLIAKNEENYEEAANLRDKLAEL